MLTIVALLIIILGLMVNIARDVRQSSATHLTLRLLANLDLSMQHYLARHNQVPHVAPIVPPDRSLPDEEPLLRAARKNNEDVIRALRSEGLLVTQMFGELPISIYDERSLRDAWGVPIVFVPHRHPQIGMAPQDAPFFFSAGPDRRFRTRDDNLYSYETTGPASPP